MHKPLYFIVDKTYVYTSKLNFLFIPRLLLLVAYLLHNLLKDLELIPSIPFWIWGDEISPSGTILVWLHSS